MSAKHLDAILVLVEAYVRDTLSNPVFRESIHGALDHARRSGAAHEAHRADVAERRFFEVQDLKRARARLDADLADAIDALEEMVTQHFSVDPDSGGELLHGFMAANEGAAGVLCRLRSERWEATTGGVRRKEEA